MTNTPISTERLEEILAGVIGWLAALDYPDVGTQMQRLTDVLAALRQQAQPTREEPPEGFVRIDVGSYNLGADDAYDRAVKVIQRFNVGIEDHTGQLPASVIKTELSSAIRALKSDAPAREAGGETAAFRYRERGTSLWSYASEPPAKDEWGNPDWEVQPLILASPTLPAEPAASTIAENATVEPAAHSLQTEWVEWRGLDVSPFPDPLVEIRRRDGRATEPDTASAFIGWVHNDRGSDIIAYRVLT